MRPEKVAAELMTRYIVQQEPATHTSTTAAFCGGLSLPRDFQAPTDGACRLWPGMSAKAQLTRGRGLFPKGAFWTSMQSVFTGSGE